MSLATRSPRQTVAKVAPQMQARAQARAQTQAQMQARAQAVAQRQAQAQAKPRPQASMRPDLAAATQPMPPDKMLQGALGIGSKVLKALPPIVAGAFPNAAANALRPAAPPATPPAPASPLPSILSGAPVSLTGPIPNASGAGAITGVPPWMTLLSQIPGFGDGGFNSLFGNMAEPQTPLQQTQLPGQDFNQGRNPFDNMPSFGPVQFRNLLSLASSLQGGRGSIGQGPAGMGGQGGGADAGGARVAARNAPALQEGGLAQLLQSLVGGNATRFANTFGGAQQFPFSPFLRGGSGFGSGNPFAGFNPFGGMGGGMQPGGGGMGMGGGLPLGSSDPRANDMRKLLLQNLFGGGGMGNGGLDVN